MSTTESSDWAASGPWVDPGTGLRSHSEPSLPGPDPPPVPMLSSSIVPNETSSSSESSRDVSSNQMMNTLATTENAREEDAFAPPENVVPNNPTTNPIVPSQVPPLTRPNTPIASAPSDNLLSQMVTSQDVDATPSQRAFMARGLGRGNRGVRGPGVGRGQRGGRPPKIKIEPPPQESEDAVAAPPRKANRGGRPRGSRAGQSSASSTRGINRGGRPRGSRAGFSASSGRGGGLGRGGYGFKRKRKSSGGGEDDDEEDINSDSSEEITALPTQSRSGRRITQVVTPIPLESDLFEPTLKPTLTKRSSLATPSDHPTSSTKKPAKRKRVTLSAVCKNCGRGHSPQSNQIVFCDGCNTPWHQYCHDRPITPTVIREEEKEWHCGDCEVQAEEAGYMVGRIPPAEGMGLAEKRRALEAMDKAELVALLLRASTLYPDLAILKPPPPPETWTAAAVAAAATASAAAVAAAAAAANTTTTTTTTTTTAAATTTPQGAVAKGEADFEYYDEPLPYPRAGNGVRLPPEEFDGELLIDDDVVTYSHSWMDRGGAWTGAMGDDVVGNNRFGPPRSSGTAAVEVAA